MKFLEKDYLIEYYESCPLRQDFFSPIHDGAMNAHIEGVGG